MKRPGARTLWLSGLPGSGKTTLARELVRRLEGSGRRARLLDGDELRKTLSSDLGFSREDREEHLLRVARLCRSLNEEGAIAVAALISPYRMARDKARALVGNFHEVFVSCPVDVCIARDPKGLYRKALAGEIRNFTGISDPYEEPLAPELVLHTDRKTIEECVRSLLEYLRTPILALTSRQAADLRMILSGAYAPLDGFCRSRDYRPILERMRLADRRLWPVPITLDVSRAGAQELPLGGAVHLSDEAGSLLAALRLEDVYEYSREEEALAVFKTADPRHPGVRELLAQEDLLLGGALTPRGRSLLPGAEPSPGRLREEFSRRGWRRVVAFQTRNPVHRAHEELIRRALEEADGVLLHPLIGPAKDDDVPAEVRLRCYEALFPKYLPQERVLLAPYPAPMRYAGPREALLHALARANCGCAGFIVGRDAAGFGGFYGPYEAQALLRSLEAELPIRPLFFKDFSWCRGCGSMAEEGACGHSSSQRLALSGSKLRELLSSGERPPEELVRPEVAEILESYYHAGSGSARNDFSFGPTEKPSR